ncbi:MAG: hypothetical protein ABI640_20665 [Gammaproteobacteria bacterium]
MAYRAPGECEILVCRNAPREKDGLIKLEVISGLPLLANLEGLTKALAIV